MADSQPLLSFDGDPVAAEALLQDVFGIVVDEVIRKGTSASEKVGLFSLLLLLSIKPDSDLSPSVQASPQNPSLPHCVPQGLHAGSDCIYPVHVLLGKHSKLVLSASLWCLLSVEMWFGQPVGCVPWCPRTLLLLS